mgnify:CR=1 FL=1
MFTTTTTTTTNYARIMFTPRRRGPRGVRGVVTGRGERAVIRRHAHRRLNFEVRNLLPGDRALHQLLNHLPGG